MPPDPRTDDDAVSGGDVVGWRASMAGESASLLEHNAFKWVDPPQYIFKRSREGFITGGSTTRTECLVDRNREQWFKVSTRLTLWWTRQHTCTISGIRHLLTANDANKGFMLRQVGIMTAFELKLYFYQSAGA